LIRGGDAGDILVGIAMPTRPLERWNNDGANLETLLGDVGYQTSLQFADNKVDQQMELALSPYLSIAENIFLGNEQAKGGVIDWNRTNAEAAKLLAMVGLDSDPVTRVVEIGVGRQQLVEIAKALSKDVKLIILDEPTAALNDEDSANLLALMVGRSLENRCPDHESAIGAEVLRVEDWTVHHPIQMERKVVDNASLSVRSGEVVGLARAWPRRS